jgi:hypothetical protein
LTAGAEGGAYGGINAATEGQPIAPGILAGTVGGAVGQGVAQGASALGNKAAKVIQGVDDAAPARNMTTFGNIKTPSARDRVDVAAARAEHAGNVAGTAEATQQAQKDEFGRLLTGANKKQFTPRQRELMGNIAYGDPGTQAASNIGGVLSDKLVAAGVGGALGLGTGGVVPGMLATGATLGGGKLLKLDSARATQDAVDNLRRLMVGKKAFKGPISAERARTAGQGLGYAGYSGLEDYLGE